MSQSEQKKVDGIVDDFKARRARRTSLEEKWLDYYKRLELYRDYTAEELEDIELGITTDIRIPLERTYVETKRPRFINTIFSFNPIVRALAHGEGAEQNKDKVQGAVNYVLRNRLYKPMFHATTQALTIGTGIIGLGWAQDKTPYGFEEFPLFHFIDTFNFYPPDGVLDLSDAEVVYRRLLKGYKYLEKQAEKGNYDAKAVAKLKEKSEYDKDMHDSYYAERMQILGLSIGEKEDKAALGIGADDQIIELIEKWERDKVTTIANRSVVIREKEHMFKGIIPFYAIKDYPSDTMFYAKGEIELLADVPDYQREIKNLRMDIIRRVAYPAALVSRNAKIPKEDLVIRPYQVIRTYDMEGYKEINRPDVKKILVDEEFIARSDGENSTGLYSYLKGGEAPRAETATTALAMKEAGMERINTMIFNACEEFIKPICRDLLAVMQKNLDVGMWVKFPQRMGMAPPIEQVKKHDLEGMYTWEPSAFTIKSVADVNLQQNMMQLYDRLRESSNINMMELDRQLVEAFNVKNVDDLILPGPQAQLMEFMKHNPQAAEFIMTLMRQPELIGVFQRLGAATRQPGAIPGNGGGMPIIPGGASTAGLQIPGATMGPEVTPGLEEQRGGI